MIDHHIALAAALYAAAQTKLLTSLIEGMRTPAEHAAALGIDARATASVLDLLVAFGIASRDGERIGASEELKALQQLLPIGLDVTMAMWGHTPEFLRTGKPFMRMDGADKQRYATVVGSLGRMADAAARAFAERLVLPSPPTKILDVGCGSGVWSLAIAARQPGASVTGLDRSDVLPAFQARATELGLADRIDVIAGDVHEVVIPREFDVVIIANVLRLDLPDRSRRIVERAAAGLVPGGTMIVIDALAGGTPALEQARTTYGLHLSMRTENGRVYTPATVTEWMTRAGLRDCRKEMLSGPGAVAAIIGRS